MAGASCFALSPQSHNPYSAKFISKMDYSGTAISFRNSSSISPGSFPTRSLSFANNLKFKNAIPQTRMLRLNCINEVSPNLEIKSKPSSLTALELLKSSGASRYTKESSSILVIGFNYETTPIAIREKLSIPEAGWAEAIGELCALNHIEEAAVLSTCNRIEIYVVALSQNRGIKEVTEWMSKKSSVPVSELSQHKFVLQNNDATKHLFDVASGLDSLVLGEGQILSQVKQVVKTGEGVPGFDRKLGGMFKHALTTGKRVRTETNISTGSVSVSSAAVELAMMKLPESSRATARMLVVGAGKMGKLLIRHLAAKGCKKIVVVNRTKDKVVSILKDIKEDVEIVYQPLSEMLTCAVEADVVFTCTASETLLFSKDEFQKLGSGQKIFVDISVPRNVDSHVLDIDSIQVYNVDDLKEVVASNKHDRWQKVMDAQAIIADEVRQFEAWKDSLETVSTIKKLRASAERIRVSEVDKCLSKMGSDCPENVKRVVNDLSLGIVNKLLDGPMKHLRCKGSDNRSLDEILENMHAVNRIFGLDTDTSLLEEKIRVKMEKSKKAIS